MCVILPPRPYAKRPDPLIGPAPAMCKAVARRDLEGMPVYILRKSQLPKDLGGGVPRCGGFTAEALDLCLRGEIGDRWKGRGVCMVAEDRTTADVFQAVVLHELAHVLDRTRPVIPLMYATEAEVVKYVTPAIAEMNEPATERRSAAINLHHHEAGFVRLLLHGMHRAARCGFLPDASAAFVWWRESSRFEEYRDAIDGEPARMSDLTFSAIRAIPVPAALVRLWEADAARVRASAPQPP